MRGINVGENTQIGEKNNLVPSAYQIKQGNYLGIAGVITGKKRWRE
jgi:hypothetical protein